MGVPIEQWVTVCARVRAHTAALHPNNPEKAEALEDHLLGRLSHATLKRQSHEADAAIQRIGKSVEAVKRRKTHWFWRLWNRA